MFQVLFFFSKLKKYEKVSSSLFILKKTLHCFCFLTCLLGFFCPSPREARFHRPSCGQMGEADAEISVSFLCGLPSPSSHILLSSRMQKGDYQIFSLLGKLVILAFLGCEILVYRVLHFLKVSIKFDIGAYLFKLDILNVSVLILLNHKQLFKQRSSFFLGGGHPDSALGTIFVWELSILLQAFHM